MPVKKVLCNALLNVTVQASRKTVADSPSLFKKNLTRQFPYKTAQSEAKITDAFLRTANIDFMLMFFYFIFLKAYFLIKHLFTHP